MSDLSATIHLLGDLLGEVLRAQEGPDFFATEEQIRSLAKARRGGDASAGPGLARSVQDLSVAQARVVATAFTLYFDLVNVAEESSRIATLREHERQAHPAPLAESIGDAIARLSAQGATPADVAALVRDLSVELVLTAHPTEAKRRSVLSKIERVTDALRALRGADLLPRERDSLVSDLRAEITALWLTSRARTNRPSVTDEVRTNLYFVDSVLWDAFPRVEAELREALAKWYPGVVPRPGWLRLASWVGGDRDGNPNVTAAVTAEALRLHRGLAIERHRSALARLARHLSLSGRRVPAPAALTASIEARRPFPEHVSYLERRYGDEPYRLALALLAADLEAASHEDMAAHLLDDAPHAARVTAAQIEAPLRMMSEVMPSPLASRVLQPLRDQVAEFGLHAAALDLREDAVRLTAALGEVLRALGRDAGFLESAGVSGRTAALVRLLEEATPVLASRPGVTESAAETWALFRLARRAQSTYGSEILGPFIISMTRGSADVLTALLLARWSGCAPMAIVPLFETLADLTAGPRVLDELFALPAYRTHLTALGGGQTVMIGYSDSNKDGGYAAANWALYRAQEEIDSVGRSHGVPITFFHGRGGTVARGGGPAHRAVLAQPPGTIHGRLRVTEQGEIVAARYGEADLAHRHLEQIVSAVLLASLPGCDREGCVPEAWRAAMDSIAGRAATVYRELVYETPAFTEFWRAATPIEEIGQLRIGSRPSLRRGRELTITAVRAIPWVFSWMQSRFNLPSWYGLGSGLAAGFADPDARQGLTAMYERWPFFRNLLDNAEMSLLKADLGIAALYVELVPDAASAAEIFRRIRDEYERTCAAVLEISGHRALLEAKPVIARSVERRNPYVDPLNYLQVEILRRLRALPHPEATEAADLREIVVLTINGIAAGLRNTG